MPEIDPDSVPPQIYRIHLRPERGDVINLNVPAGQTVGLLERVAEEYAIRLTDTAGTQWAFAPGFIKFASMRVAPAPNRRYAGHGF